MFSVSCLVDFLECPSGRVFQELLKLDVPILLLFLVVRLCQTGTCSVFKAGIKAEKNLRHVIPIPKTWFCD